MTGEVGATRSAAGILRGIDRASFAVALGDRLRQATATVDLTAVSALVQAFAIAAPRTRRELYWTCRVTLVRQHTDIPVFDSVFDAVFADAVLELDPNARRKSLAPPPRRPDDVLRGAPRGDGVEDSARELPWATPPAMVGTGERTDDEAVRVPLRLPTDATHLADTPFSDFHQRDLDLLEATLARFARRWPQRRTRRESAGASGRRIGLRDTIARSRRTGFEPAQLVRRRPRYQPRRVVLVCDVSASMQPHAAAYLHLMRALARGGNAEVFAFATRLTRLTGALSHRSPIDAIDAASAAVGDRFGGTRIGSNIAGLLAGPHRDLLRGAIVLVGSDGWDTDDAAILGQAMERLRRRAHRVLWLNPRASAPQFQPTVAGMAAALPHCDRLLPGATMAELVRVIAAVCDDAAT